MTRQQIADIAHIAVLALQDNADTIEVATHFVAIIEVATHFSDNEDTRTVRVSLNALEFLDGSDEDECEWHEDEIFNALTELSDNR